MSSSHIRETPLGLLRASIVVDPRRAFALAASFGLCLVSQLAIPYLLGETVDAAVQTRDLPSVVSNGLAMIVAAILLYIGHWNFLWLEARLIAEATFNLRRIIYQRLIVQPLSYFTGRNGGEIGHRVMSDANVFERDINYLLTDLPFAVLTVLGVVAVMFWSHWQLATVVGIVLCSSALLAQRVARPLAGIEKSENAAYARLGGRLQEIIAGIRTVKLFARETTERDRLDAAGKDIVDVNVRSGNVAARLEPLLEAIEQFGLVAVVWCGAYFIYDGSLTAGRLVAFIAYMELLAEPLQRAGRYLRHYHQGRGTLERIAEFLSTMPEADGTIAQSRVAPPNAVSVRTISFVYPGSPQAAVDRVSFDAMLGDIVAIVGPNGAGKSTLLDLLIGFHKPTSGQILIDGVELPEGESLHQHIAVVSQDVFLFNATLEENIRYGRMDATAGELDKAIEEAGLTAFASGLPKGLQTVVGDRGTKLSGGERQKVAIARMLLRRSRIVLLDEPAAALDGAALTAVNTVIRTGAPQRITFVVAHRREMVALANKIIVMQKGKLVASGTLEEVRQASPLFRKLFDVSER